MVLKEILKKIKLNENNISMVLGVLVIVVTGILVVNYFKNIKTTNLFKTGGEAASTVNATPGKHTVAKGESLWKIAQKYYGDGYKWVEIAKANNISNPGSIEAGQELNLPQIDKQEKAETAVKTEVKTESTNTTQVSGTITGATYEVVKGDSLWKIAVRAYGDGYQWVKIASENKLANPDLIHPGNVMALPR